MADDTLRIEDAVNETCPWSGKPIAADSLTRLSRCRGRASAIPAAATSSRRRSSHFDKALAERDEPLIAKGIE